MVYFGFNGRKKYQILKNLAPMKIIKINPERDVYDPLMKYGINNLRPYIRDSKVINIKNGYSTKFDILGFCGKIYPFRNFSYASYGSWERHPKTFCLYKEESYTYQFIFPQRYPYNKNAKITKVELSKESSAKLKTEYDALTNNKELLSLFLKYKTPIFYIPYSSYADFGICNVNINRHDNLLITHYKLENIAFQTVLTPIQIFQEIEMFINNDLVDQMDGLQIPETDLNKRDRHGFDKYSFRKDKENK